MLEVKTQIIQLLYQHAKQSDTIVRLIIVLRVVFFGTQNSFS